MKRSEAETLLKFYEARLKIVKKEVKDSRELMASYRSSKADQIPVDKIWKDLLYGQAMGYMNEVRNLEREIEVLTKLLTR